MAKFCGKCGSALNDTAVFCGGCGAKVPARSARGISPVQTAYAPVPSSFAPAAPAPPDTRYGAFSPVPASFTPVGRRFLRQRRRLHRAWGVYASARRLCSCAADTCSGADLYPGTTGLCARAGKLHANAGGLHTGERLPDRWREKIKHCAQGYRRGGVGPFCRRSACAGRTLVCGTKDQGKGSRCCNARALAGNGPGSAGMGEFLKGVADLKGDSGSDAVQGDLKEIHAAS